MENEKFKFLNVGVASYSSYIYLKKIESVIDENKDLKIKNVIVFLDKSDVNDDENYLSEPKKFKNTKTLSVCWLRLLKSLKDHAGGWGITSYRCDIFCH